LQWVTQEHAAKMAKVYLLVMVNQHFV
jgi:hypothetical protein